MTRAEKRALKKQIRNDIKEFLKIQAHYFPDLIEDIKKNYGCKESKLCNL